MLSESFLRGFKAAMSTDLPRPKPGERAARRSSPLGAYDSALSFDTWLRSLSSKQLKKARLAFDEVMLNGERDDETAPQGQKMAKQGDGDDGPLPPEIMSLLKAKLSEQEMEAVCMALQQRAEDQEKEQDPAACDEPPPFSGRPTAGGTADPITNASRGKSGGANDSALRRSMTPGGQLAYDNGTVAHGTYGGVEYRHGIPVKDKAKPAKRSSEASFAERFPGIARIRSV